MAVALRSLVTVAAVGIVAGLAGVALLMPVRVQPPQPPPAVEPAKQHPTPPQPAPATTAMPAPAPLSLPTFAAFVDALKPDALAKGITAPTFDAAFAGLSPDPEVLDLAGVQPEHAKTAGEYVGLLVSETRLANGRLKLQEHAATLAAVEATSAVDRHVILAIWGIESNYGAGMGTRRVVRSLATLAAFDPRRPDFWRGELLAALRILQAGDTTPENLAGSWAGAMGHTQFMPSTFAAHAVDFDRDGRRDIWSSIPDALGSTANYLKVSGWVAGLPWGFEVKLPGGFDYALSAPGQAKAWAQWQALGVGARRPGPAPPAPGPWQLLLPAGAKGPAFLVSGNFRAILRYNNAVSYALAVGHLADRLAGGAAFEQPWPADDKALGKADREELQRQLTALGFGTGAIDGIIGGGTRTAIRAYQKARNIPEDGHPDLALLERLRQEGKP
jgi:membrane-bound lytic murein transglycosylase B